MQEVVPQLRSLAIRALARMYRPEEHLFAFRLRRTAAGHVLEGVSRRYTAISLIGLSREPDSVASTVLGGQGLRDVCGYLVNRTDQPTDLGEVALTHWAARALDHRDAAKSLAWLASMRPAEGNWSCVELSWCLTALSIPSSSSTDEALAQAVARRLLASFHECSAMFPHWPAGTRRASLRSHVACFADLVYPIQALSYYYRATGDGDALNAARLCAARMCELQGPGGQWWWHYDVRTGRVIEGYPVYAVHQEAMAPMALSALQEADGEDRTDAAVKGLEWLVHPPEIEGSLIDEDADIIWRKVARREPLKVSRGVQALASRLSPSFRMLGLDLVFRPTFVDYESRPYEMGWILHGWPRDRAGNEHQYVRERGFPGEGA
jgi:hypothetical protein